MDNGIIIHDGDRKIAILYNSIACVDVKGLIVSVYIIGKEHPIVLYPQTEDEKEKWFNRLTKNM